MGSLLDQRNGSQLCCRAVDGTAARDASTSLATEATKRAWMKQYGLDEKRWLEVTADYRPGCGSAPYTFVSLTAV